MTYKNATLLNRAKIEDLNKAVDEYSIPDKYKLIELSETTKSKYKKMGKATRKRTKIKLYWCPNGCGKCVQFIYSRRIYYCSRCKKDIAISRDDLREKQEDKNRVKIYYGDDD